MQSVFRSTFVGVLALAALTACGDKGATNVNNQVQSVVVSPQSANIGIGDKFTFVANVTATGNAARTVTWSTGDATVATVDANGVVTGVKGGTTSIIATSTANTAVQGAASVTVAATVPPTVSIAAINHTVAGTGSVPVDQSNVQGQIDVLVNLDAGTQKVSSVSLIMSCGGKDTTVQTQTISAGDIAPLGADESASTIPFSFNTGAFNPATGAVAFKNGVCTIKASAVTSSGTVVASSGEQLTLNNTDTVSVTTITTTPSTGQVAQANDAAGLVWHAGAVNVTAVPVIFSTGSVSSGSISLVNVSGANALGQAAAVVGNNVAIATISGITPASGVLTATFPNSTTAASGVGGATVNGLGVTVTTVNSSGNNGPILTATSATATAANTIRLDNLAPDLTTTPPTDTLNQNSTGGWVGKNFVFSVAAGSIRLGSAANDVTSGVAGVDNVVDTTQVSQSGGSFANFASPSALPETSTGSADALRLKICDALGNCKNTGTLTTFGIDLTAPTLSAVAGAGPKDQQVFNSASTVFTTAAFAVTDTSGTPGVTASGSNGVLAQVQGLRPSGATSSQTVCPVGNTTGSAPAVTCKSPSAQPLTFTIPSTAGEYTMVVQGLDQAGNTSAPLTVHYYVDQVAPVVAGGVAVPASITSGSQFTSTATDSMDVAAGNGNLQYTTLGVKFAESGTGSPTGVVFDNTLTRSSNIAVTLNPFYRTLTNAFNTVGEKPEFAGIRAVDAAGNLAVNQQVALPATNIANGTAFSSSDPAVGISAWAIAASPNPVDSLKTTTITASATAVSATSGSPFTQVCFFELSTQGTEGGVAGPGGSASGELFSLGCTGAETTTGVFPSRLLNYSISFTAPVITGGGTITIFAIGNNAGGDGLMTAPLTLTVNP